MKFPYSKGRREGERERDQNIQSHQSMSLSVCLLCKSWGFLPRRSKYQCSRMCSWNLPMDRLGLDALEYWTIQLKKWGLISTFEGPNQRWVQQIWKLHWLDLDRIKRSLESLVNLVKYNKVPIETCMFTTKIHQGVTNCRQWWTTGSKATYEWFDEFKVMDLNFFYTFIKNIH